MQVGSLTKYYSSILHLCLTGLPEVAMPYSDMWQDWQITFPHTRSCYAKSSYRSVDPKTIYGNVHQVNHVPNGPTNSAITTVFPLRLCGGKLLVAVTRERRYGPSRLRVNDDDDCKRKFELQLHLTLSSEVAFDQRDSKQLSLPQHLHCISRLTWPGSNIGRRVSI